MAARHVDDCLQAELVGEIINSVHGVLKRSNIPYFDRGISYNGCEIWARQHRRHTASGNKGVAIAGEHKRRDLGACSVCFQHLGGLAKLN